MEVKWWEQVRSLIFSRISGFLGGDGTAQLLCKNEEAQSIVCRMVAEELGKSSYLILIERIQGMFGIPLTIEPVSRVTSAIIPAGM